MRTAAALTMVRDDAFFLRAWLRHYGGLFGRQNCFVINHGRGAEVARLAEGCSVIGIPGDPDPAFDRKRWQMLNNFVSALRQYYTHVIVGDVDELVVVDPETGMDLNGFLAQTPPGQMLTPLGLEVIHRVDLEDQAIDDTILGPRRHVRPAPHYSKPCIASNAAKISRGGHYSYHDKLNAPDALLLMHLKFCDFPNYVDTMDRRNAVAEAAGATIRQASIGGHWFAEKRGEDRALFDGFADLEMQEGFNLRPLRRKMRRSWGPRPKTKYYEFARPDYKMQFLLPERFNGLF